MDWISPNRRGRPADVANFDIFHDGGKAAEAGRGRHVSLLSGRVILQEEPMTALTERDIQRNMQAVAHAIAQQALESLTVTPL
jgi:hypothetical protein